MTKELRKIIMNRSRYKNKYFKNKTVENWEKYREHRDDCVKLTKKVKREYFQNLKITSINDNKTFWKTVKPFFSDKGNKDQKKIILMENGEIIRKDKINAISFNDYFINITRNLDIQEIEIEPLPLNTDIVCTDPIDTILYNYKNHPSTRNIRENITSTDTFVFSQINESQIKKEIRELNPNKSAGFDSIPPNIIKDSAEVLTSSLTDLFNTSVINCLFPSDLKYANVSPLHKKDDTTNKENYRPVSILPSISKIYERLMFQQISNYISGSLSPYLCGFRKGYSAQHALLRLKNTLNLCLDKKENIGMFMMDLSKAFDCISHELLIAKLHVYGFSKASLKLTYNYLKGRNQRVKINADYNSWREILSGVPQGSILVPLLFNIFINDLFFCVKNSEICNYADDNSLTVADADLDKIIAKLETDIDILNTWFINNGMLLNEDKCHFMIIEPSWNTRKKIERIKLRNETIEETNIAKLLGITFDNKLTMNDHIKIICKQASSKLYALARISN